MQENMLADAVVAVVETNDAPAPVETNDAPALTADATPVETNDKPAGKPRKKPAGKKPAAAKPATTTSYVERDGWGCRKTSSAHGLNRVLARAKEPMTSKALHERAGRATPGATYCHLRSLIVKGYVMLKDGAFTPTKKGRKAWGGRAEGAGENETGETAGE